MGMALGVLSFAAWTRIPIMGAMINNYGNYNAAIIFAGVTALAGALIIFARMSFARMEFIA